MNPYQEEELQFLVHQMHKHDAKEFSPTIFKINYKKRRNKLKRDEVFTSSAILTSAPASNNAQIISKYPRAQADCKGVSPF